MIKNAWLQLAHWAGQRILHGTAIGSTGWTDFFGQNIAKPLFAAASTLKVSSSSEDDVMTTGDGAWKVRVHGLDSDYLPLEEVFELDGQDAVEGEKEFFRVNGAEVIASKEGAQNIGDIYVYGSDDVPALGVPADPETSLGAKIIAGEGVARCASFTVPAGKSVAIFRMTFGQYDTEARYARVRYGVALPGGITRFYALGGMSTAALASLVIDLPVPLIIPEKADFRLQMIGSAAGSTLDATLFVAESAGGVLP
ncbi:MAG TPA: hypothetical protein PLE60_13615 [Candidatus Latescibacteria bacterium]|nr:hypothetical protein [Spirochaetota bacterium]HPU86360.1 hypothetical protein [Candidatus Latescibacterota bacterium]